MAVVDSTTVDQVAQGPDGRVVLAMTEDRRYGAGDVDALIGDFQRKLNAYVYLIRSGQLRQMVGGRDIAGVDIRLYTVDQPPPRDPGDDRCRFRGPGRRRRARGLAEAHSVDLPDCLATIGRSLSERAPVGWAKIELSTSLVGDGLAGGLVATSASGEAVPLNPDPVLIGALNDLKRARWTRSPAPG